MRNKIVVRNRADFDTIKRKMFTEYNVNGVNFNTLIVHVIDAGFLINAKKPALMMR